MLRSFPHYQQLDSMDCGLSCLRGDRNGRITLDRTILPADKTDREGRILRSLGVIMHLV